MTLIQSNAISAADAISELVQLIPVMYQNQQVSFLTPKNYRDGKWKG